MWSGPVGQASTPNATHFSQNRAPALEVGQDSSPAAGVHAGLLALGYG